ncbi:TetR/AcrR family transcriptional regulator [Shimia abyssi]|uniref:TetR family transcriptional regulator n=1 Tax=Shimia abyssi TaxID=1662395 RepID=A0A2P8FJZ9_9RHOB|nr:TetR/AcrR family transcriptional regulator [Shimia abyssi]PSL22009.1 TetR family transcriptional regulator [Shimia abyssi]
MARTIAKDHDQKRDRILTAAARVFAHEGFDRASMSMLARECGISKANIYHYYDSKDAILYDILETYLSALRDRVCGIDLTGLDAEARVHCVIREILMAYQGADDEHRVQINGVAMLPIDQQTVLRGYQRDMVVFLGDVLNGAAPEVFEADKAKLRAAVMSVFGMLNWYYMWQSGAGTQAREDYAKLVADLSLKGLRGL